MMKEMFGPFKDEEGNELYLHVYPPQDVSYFDDWTVVTLHWYSRITGRLRVAVRRLSRPNR